MPRGNASQSKVHYQGKEEDFVVYIDDIEAVQKWKSDRSIPLAQVVSGFKIFVTHKYESFSSHPKRETVLHWFEHWFELALTFRSP